MHPEQLTDKNYQAFIQEHDFIIVDYYADWCGPCQMMLPIFDELTTKLSSTHPQVTFAKINIDESRTATDEAGVMSVPTFIVYKKGETGKVEEIDRHIGGASASDLEKFVISNL